MIKREKVITCLAGMIFVLTGIFAGEALAAGIVDSKHNLSSVAGAATRTINSIYSTNNDEICVFCHTPHGAIKSDNIPLWNQKLSTHTPYGVYTSPNMRQGTTSDVAEVAISATNSGAVSNLCLSCHDGTVAIGSMNNPSSRMTSATAWNGFGGAASGVMPGAANLGTDLTDDHPVNFTYVTTNATLTPRASLTAVKLFDNKVQCASCHDPHSSEPLFLRVTMAKSQLCLTCHIK